MPCGWRYACIMVATAYCPQACGRRVVSSMPAPHTQQSSHVTPGTHKNLAWWASSTHAPQHRAHLMSQQRAWLPGACSTSKCWPTSKGCLGTPSPIHSQSLSSFKALKTGCPAVMCWLDCCKTQLIGPFSPAAKGIATEMVACTTTPSVYGAACIPSQHMVKASKCPSIDNHSLQCSKIAA